MCDLKLFCTFYRKIHIQVKHKYKGAPSDKGKVAWTFKFFFIFLLVAFDERITNIMKASDENAYFLTQKLDFHKNKENEPKNHIYGAEIVGKKF